MLIYVVLFDPCDNLIIPPSLPLKVRKLKPIEFNDMIEVPQLALELGFEHRQSGSRVCVLNHYTIIMSLIITRMSWHVSGVLIMGQTLFKAFINNLMR